MKVGDLVVHKEYPSGPPGRIVAKTKKRGHIKPIFLVLWSDNNSQSRHIEHALTKVLSESR